MNPIRIECQNFRSYKKLNLSFDDDGVIPIIGDNGTGKSSIFYAISLALYGKVLADNTEVPVKDLILDDGSTELLVKFIFMHNSEKYSIERIYKKSISKSDVEKYDQVKCEFNKIVGDTNILLSSKGKGPTNAKIISILGKDCNNFCNSIFFPQGEESRLAKLTPSKFIEEISNLKNITIWEQLRVKANKELDNITSMIDSMELYIKDSLEEISHKEEVLIRIKELDIIIKNKRIEIDNIDKKIEEILFNKNTYNNSLSQIKRIESDIKEIKEEIEEIQDDINFSENKIEEYNGIIFNKDNILSDYDKYGKLILRKEEIDKILYEKTELIENISKVEKVVKEAEFNINRELNELSNKSNIFNSLFENEASIKDRYNYCINGLKSIESLQDQYDQAEVANQQYIIEITKLNSRNEQLNLLITEEVNNVRNLINTCTCSECERPIDSNGLEQIKSYKTIKIDNYKLEGRSNIEKINELNNYININKKLLSNLKLELSKKSSLTIEIGQLQNKISNIDNAHNEIRIIDPKINELRNIINNRTYSNQIDYLNSLIAKLNSIDYNENEYNSIVSELRLLKDINLKLNKLEETEKQLPSLELKKIELNTKINNKKNKLKELMLSFNNYNKDKILESINTTEKLESDYKLKLEEYRKEFNSSMKDFGSQQNMLENMLNKEEKIKEKIVEIDKSKRKQYLFERAIDMYSKSGIPTLIIESMLPAIEKEANKLLQLMMSEYTLCFDRPKKADGTFMDKIVIMIRGRRGKKRPFNTFSGAEAFQISFALRVAICGAEDVIFIDEGFGKLDPEKLKLIIKTLGALKTKFNKIILITHIEKIIDMFDIRLKVEIDDDGLSKTKWIRG
jgi:exonuclease SbcC